MPDSASASGDAATWYADGEALIDAVRLLALIRAVDGMTAGLFDRDNRFAASLAEA